MFLRTPRSFVGHLTPLVRPRASSQLDYEGEVVLVIGKAGRHIPESAALDHVAAITLCNEGTIRDWVRHAKFNVTQARISIPPAASGRGSCPTPPKARSRMFASRHGSTARRGRTTAPAG